MMKELRFLLMITMMMCVFLAGMAITAGQMRCFYCCMAAGIFAGIAAWIFDSEVRRKERKRR